MMQIFSARSNGFQFIFGLMCLIEASQICLSWVSAASSDMLIIRHGRSRVRHSTEKNHIRWGLQAFDNLTLYDYDYENANGTNGSNETLFDFGLNGGGNQTFLGSESFGYFASDTLFNNGTYTSGNLNSESKLISTLAPSVSVSSSQRWATSTLSTPSKNPKLAKKQIMENIRKNVEEGIEYLRTHAHLTQPTAVMPSEKALLQLQKQAEQLAHNTDKARMPIERDESFSPSDETISFSASDPFSISKHLKSPSSSSSSSLLGLFNHPHTEHNQSNKKKHKIDKQLQWKSHQVNKNHNNNNNDDDTMSNNRVDDTDHSDAHPFDYEMQNDEPPSPPKSNGENVHQSETHPYKSNKSNKSNPRYAHESSSASSSSAGVNRNKNIMTMKTIDSIVTSIHAAVSKKSFDQAINNGGGSSANGAKTNLNGNSNATKANLRSQSNTKITSSRSQLTNEKRKETTNASTKTATQTKFGGIEMSPVSSMASLISSHPFDSDTLLSSSSSKQNESTPSNVKTHPNLNNNQFDSNGFLSPSDELNDEQQANDDNGDDTNTFPFDANYEQTITFDGKTINSNDVIQLPIFRMEDMDLDDLDEISRNNRLNLQKGRDVVTKFLQIVESQHLLGANCTAGTALNLGEGVVDRYAQDRFRVEAEVAVNRANMLTRFVFNSFFFRFSISSRLKKRTCYKNLIAKKKKKTWFCRVLFLH